MFENTGTPSTGQPVPVSGLQFGEEYLRKPTSVMGLGFGPVTLGVGPYGRFRVIPAGISLAAIVYELSALYGPQARLVSPVAVEIACRSLQVCGLPWLIS